MGRLRAKGLLAPCLSSLIPALFEPLQPVRTGATRIRRKTSQREKWRSLRRASHFIILYAALSFTKQ